jgi:hypothetical protein
MKNFGNSTKKSKQMKKLSNIVLILISIALIIAVDSCEKGPQFRKFTYPPQTASGLAPDSGFPGSYVTISGKNFDTLTGAVKVWFGSILADSVISCTNNQIIVKVPDDAVSGKVSLKVWTNLEDSIGTFSVVPAPAYSMISTDRAKAGAIVTITGDNFGSDASKVKVLIGTAEAEIVSFSNTQIQFKVPDVPSGTLVLAFGSFKITGPPFFIGDEKLKGRLIGHSGSWGNNPATTIAAAVDSNLNTFVDAPTSTGYVGYDFGSGKGAHVTLVRFAPRDGYPDRMMGGEIRGANDPTLDDAVTLYKITQAPPVGSYTSVTISTSQTYRYVYYYAPTGNCDIAEIEFYGQLEDNPLPVGKLIYEFEIDGDNEGWTPQQGGTWTVNNNAMNVTFTQTSGKKRADLAQTIHSSNGTVVLQTGDYPIVAIKFNKPATCNITLDTDLGSVGNGSNKFKTDFESKDVYYWDLSTQTFGSTLHSNEQLTLSTFQIKIADVPQDDPATGYSVQWIRTFSSVQQLQDFINQ